MTPVETSKGRVIIVQPALPSYRLDFFNRLHKAFGSRLVVYYSKGDLGILTETTNDSPWARTIGRISNLPGNLRWQAGIGTVILQRGDILVLSGAPRFLSNFALILKAKRKSVPVVWWGHHWSSTSKRWRQALRHIMMKAANAIVFYTAQEVAEYSAQAGAGDTRQVIGLNNGLDTTQIRPLRQPYNATLRNNRLLFIGRLTQKSNLGLLVRALSDPNLNGFRLDVIGDGEMLDLLKHDCDQLGISERVRWHGAIIDEQQIAQVANQCAVFVYPGEVGLSLVHAMAYGLPAIVHSDRRRQMPEFAAFQDKVTGVTFSADNQASLVEAINDAFADPENLTNWSSNSSERVEETFNTADMSRRFVALIDSL